MWMIKIGFNVKNVKNGIMQNVNQNTTEIKIQKKIAKMRIMNMPVLVVWKNKNRKKNKINNFYNNKNNKKNQ